MRAAVRGKMAPLRRDYLFSRLGHEVGATLPFSSMPIRFAPVHLLHQRLAVYIVKCLVLSPREGETQSKYVRLDFLFIHVPMFT